MPVLTGTRLRCFDGGPITGSRAVPLAMVQKVGSCWMQHWLTYFRAIADRGIYDFVCLEYGIVRAC